MSELKTEELPAGIEEAKAQAEAGLKEEGPVDATEMASTMLYLYTPKFNAAVDKLSSNALRRVLKKLVSFPLNDKDYKPTSQVEQDVFNVGDRLLESKFLLLLDNYHQLVQDQIKEEENK